MNSGTGKRTSIDKATIMKKDKEIIKMKNMENMNALNDMEMETVTGGIMPIFTLGPAYEPTTKEEPHDGGATYTW